MQQTHPSMRFWYWLVRLWADKNEGDKMRPRYMVAKMFDKPESPRYLLERAGEEPRNREGPMDVLVWEKVAKHLVTR